MTDSTAFDLAHARAAHPALSHLLQLNTGTKGLTAAPVVDRLVALTRRIEDDGFAGYVEVQRLAAAARDRLAAFFHSAPTALAFTGNATISLNVAMALPWRRWQDAQRGGPVDVLISDHEYPTTNMIFGYLEQIGAARLIRYALSEDTARTCDSLARQVTPTTRLVVASHVDCNTGLRTDPAALAAWCRARGIASYIDGAQAAGQFPIDLSAIGADLYITNGHKWLFGPNGVGLLYIRDGFEKELTPPFVGAGTMHFDARGFYDGPPRWVEGAHRFELQATRPAQVFATMDAALDWYESFGPGAIEARQKALTAHVKRRIQEMPDRFRLITPWEWERSSALATIQFLDKNGAVISGERIGAFCGQMFTEGKAFLRPVPEFDGLRLSMAYYNTDDEYERFFELCAHHL